MLQAGTTPQICSRLVLPPELRWLLLPPHSHALWAGFFLLLPACVVLLLGGVKLEIGLCIGN